MTAIIPYGMRTGLGQNGEATDIQEGGTYTPPAPSTQTYFPPGTFPPATSSSLTSILSSIQQGATTADTAFNQYLNAQTQQSLIQARVQQSLLTPLASLTSAAGLSSLMPLLLIGGGLVVVLMLARK